jgi:CrcB protein
MGWKNLVSVALLGFAGGVFRYVLSDIFEDANGVLMANLLGCFFMAFFTYYIMAKKIFIDALNAGLGTGMIGAFTTFSSLAAITVAMGEADVMRAFAYLLENMMGGLIMAGAGIALARRLRKEERHA